MIHIWFIVYDELTNYGGSLCTLNGGCYVSTANQ